ncbi:hypothetical protein BT96DRAFT_939424 [Gymnopus androsaceus JB14]|uniref:Uncharacterized protein n=1 Tax=Gymnopus androsaceus JB14 TaxID=1447944 RepID=A0A6A4HPB1_9AGAR|nr:hypothetical protein BT96DRAFT_939424 [Gymnopus androsaceus JB14]
MLIKAVEGARVDKNGKSKDKDIQFEVDQPSVASLTRLAVVLQNIVPGPAQTQGAEQLRGKVSIERLKGAKLDEVIQFIHQVIPRNVPSRESVKLEWIMTVKERALRLIAYQTMFSTKCNPSPKQDLPKRSTGAVDDENGGVEKIKWLEKRV